MAIGWTEDGSRVNGAPLSVALKGGRVYMCRAHAKGHSQFSRESGAQSTDWLLAGARLCGFDAGLVLWMLLPKLVPSCRRRMWRITAVALKACCEDKGCKQRGVKPKTDTGRCPYWCKIPFVFVKTCALTLHLLLAKFFRICRLTDSCMFLQRAVSPAILKIKVTPF